MQLRAVLHPDETFEAEISTEHPNSVPGSISFRRIDTGEYIALREIIGKPASIWKKYDLLVVSQEEAQRLSEAGFMVV